MRLCLLLPIAMALTAPAFAQTIACDASADNDLGEFDLSYNLDKSAVLTGIVASFVPERIAGVGSDSDYFARPRILLNYRLNDAGEIAGPASVQLLTTKFKGSFADVTMKATAPPADPITWKGSEPKLGEEKLATMLRETKPAKVKTDLIGKDGAILASASFDLSDQVGIQKLATQAKADADKMMADAKQAVADGKPFTKCPVK
jgi:hypothetical protein